MQAHEETPFVSVIVPVYNDERRIVTCVEALLAQSYPRDRYEVIVVDNGSTDGTHAAVAPYASGRPHPVTLLSEGQIQGSYAARNTGLRAARGAIIAFTDSDCTPAQHWLAEGVAAIGAGADLVGGHVRFVFSRRPSGAEVCDSISHMQMERDIRERGVAKTANLFVRADVVRQLGPFPLDFRSGGDVLWTRRATTSGYRLVYCPTAEVAHPTRRLVALLKKQYRVGRGHHDIRSAERAQGASAGRPARRGLAHKLYATLRGLMPGRIGDVRESMRWNRVEGVVSPYRVWLVAWLCRAVTTLGSLSRAGARQWRGRRSLAAK